MVLAYVLERRSKEKTSYDIYYLLLDSAGRVSRVVKARLVLARGTEQPTLVSFMEVEEEEIKHIPCRYCGREFRVVGLRPSYGTVGAYVTCPYCNRDLYLTVVLDECVRDVFEGR